MDFASYQVLTGRALIADWNTADILTRICCTKSTSCCEVVSLLIYLKPLNHMYSKFTQTLYLCSCFIESVNGFTRNTGVRALYLQIDNSSIDIEKCGKVNDVIITHKTWIQGNKQRGKSRWQSTKMHFLSSGKKSLQKTMDALNCFVTTYINEQKAKDATFVLQNLFIVSDGGPSDYHMSDFEANILKLGSEIGCEPEHIVLPPYHG